jgi:cyanophycinase
MNYKLILIVLAFGLCARSFSQPKGTLFIIGGGNRSPQLISTLISTSRLSPRDYIVILPMSSQDPDSSYYYIKIQLEKACANTIANLNFRRSDSSNSKWLDSLRHAKIIFITGGDQNRFMNVVLNNPIERAIKDAFYEGATVAGTSAGAALMSSHMITGDHLLGDTSYANTFEELRNGNIIVKEGLGLLSSAIIDQHFVVRSRYNRLLSALAMYPDLPCIGIDEGTAIIVHGNKVVVTGDSQVILFSNPQNLRSSPDGHIKFDDVHMRVFTDGDSFDLH